MSVYTYIYIHICRYVYTFTIADTLARMACLDEMSQYVLVAVKCSTCGPTGFKPHGRR